MIDEKKLIEKRPEYLNPIRVGKEEYNKGWNDCNDMWFKLVESQPKVGKWIPVSERLPKEKVSVLVTYIGWNDNKPYSNGCAYLNEDGKWAWCDDDGEVYVEITAWMPLPEAYKEGDS